MIIASKVWNKNALTNAEVAKVSRLYSQEEVDSFEQVFLASLGNSIAVGDTDYANAHFLLEIIAMKEAAEVRLPQLCPEQASQLRIRSLQRLAGPCSSLEG